MSGMADIVAANPSMERRFEESTIFHLTHRVDFVGDALEDLFWVLRMKLQALSDSIVRL
jgi:hypothetical protein